MGYQDRVVNYWEGVLCQVVDSAHSSNSRVIRSSATLDGRMVGRWYTWFVKNLWHGDDMIQFLAGGSAVTSRGPGTWRKDQGQIETVWLTWPSHKPVSLGGPAVPAHLETWLLQFDQHFDKFAAGMPRDVEHFAAGVAQETLEAMMRRIFVSVTHEWCNSAN